MTLRRLAVVLALLSRVSLYGQLAGPSAGGQDGGLVTGRVVDSETSRPVGAAIVTLAPAGAVNPRNPPRVLTDALGRFFFADVAAGRYIVTVTKPGWLPGAIGRHQPGQDATPIDVGARGRIGDLTVSLWRAAVISGRVIDETSEPLVGADVRVFQKTFAGGHAQWRFASRAITDDRGMYRVSALMPGDFLVAVPATVNTEPTTLSAAALSETYLQTMTAVGAAPMSLERSTLVTGGALRVSSILNPPDTPSGESPWTTYTTTFFPGASTVSNATVVHAAAGRERPGIDIPVRLVMTYAVSGTVSMPDGSAAASYAVHLLAADSADYPVVDAATAVTDAAGHFTFYGVAPGAYVARVVRVSPPAGSRTSICGGTGAISFVCSFTEGPSAPGAAPPSSLDPLLHADTPVIVAAKSLRDVSVRLQPGVRIGGHAEFEGTSARPTDAQWPRIWVTLEPAGGQSFTPAGGFDPIQPGQFASDGQFTTPSMWPGRYVLSVAGLPSGWRFKVATWQDRNISDTAFDVKQEITDVRVILTDRSPTLSGVVRAANGESLDAARVLWFPTDGEAWIDYGRTSRRLANIGVADGRFSAPAPPPGDYFVVALSDVGTDSWQDPAFLKRVAAVADRITIVDGQSLARPLTTRRLP